MKKLLTGLFLLFVIHVLAADDHGVYPTHWWVNMKNPKLQLMVYQPNVGDYNKATVTYAGVSVEKLTRAENKNYVFIDLRIASTAKAGTFKIRLTGGGSPIDISYQLKPR